MMMMMMMMMMLMLSLDSRFDLRQSHVPIVSCVRAAGVGDPSMEPTRLVRRNRRATVCVTELSIVSRQA